MSSHAADHNSRPCDSWIIYGSDKASLIKIQKEVDQIFSGYSFYPEIEWGKYGYRAPEGHQVLGAWRHPQTTVFAFLLDNPGMLTMKSTAQALLYVTGDPIEISKVRQKCESLKNRFAYLCNANDRAALASSQLDRIHKSKPFGIVLAVLAVFTAIINAFSVYLRKLPHPIMHSDTISIIYEYIIVIVHIGSLLLLIMVICLIAVFLFKYGRLMLRRF